MEQSIGSLWVNKEKGYTSGEINGVKVIIFKNKFKTEDKQPDYKVFEKKAVQKVEETLSDPVEDTSLPL